AVAAHARVERVHHAGHRVEAAPTIRERADARQHHAVGARHLIRIAGHDDRLLVAGLARSALERLGGRVQVAGAVIHDRNAHRRAPGCGNRPMTSGAPAGWRGGGATVTAGVGAPLFTQASKNRRSADSRSSPTITPTLMYLRRPSVKRRSVAASKPTSNASRMLTAMGP